MRRMLVFLLLLTGHPSDAQLAKNFKWGASLYADVPTGLFSTVYSLNTGAALEVEWPAFKEVSFTASPGYALFMRKGDFKNLQMLTFLVGGRYRFSRLAALSVQSGIVWPAFNGGHPLWNLTPSFDFEIARDIFVAVHYHAYIEYGFMMGSPGVQLKYFF